MSYSDAIDLDAFVVRDYAPAATRAAALIRLCHALPAYLAQARANLKTPMPRPWIDTALLQTKGLADFADHDAREAFAASGVTELGAALDGCKAALTEHAAWLEQQQPTGTADFALGPAKFVAMLAESQGIVMDLPALQQLADADLARNTAAIEAAARLIDPHKSTADVVAEAATDRPAAATVVAEATKQATDMRQFLIDHKLVTVGDEIAEVRPSPPFQRWNSAFCDPPGPFETTKLPSFYYISPPDPAWAPDVQASYLPPRADLLFTTIHEVYPGHFIDSVHRKTNPSRVQRSLNSYTTSEGWAHYAEEMMYDAGAGMAHTPRTHIGQLKEALLRNVRFVVAIGEHTGGMTVEQAETLFRTRGFVDAANAHQQAVRGTFDPMYLAYTLGKLQIMKLRDAWLIAHPGATLGAFHDEFLAHGGAPLPVIAAAMLATETSP